MFEKARALYGIQRAELLPSVSAVGMMSKQLVPADLSTTGQAMIAEQYGVNLGIIPGKLISSAASAA